MNSRRYNLVVERSGVGEVDWKSSERMREVSGYRWGLVVEHNANPAVAGRGSCIFLHVWAGPDKGTAGCTAMAQPNLEELLRWLDAKKRPALVQLTEGDAPAWVGWTSLGLAGAAIATAAARTVPAAVRLGARRDPPAVQSRLARSIFHDHLLCLAAIAAVLAVQLAFAT